MQSFVVSYCRCCSTSLITFKRLWARCRTFVSLPVEHVFLWFHPMLPPRTLPGYHPLVCTYTLRENASSASLRARYVRLYRVHAATASERREREKERSYSGPLVSACLSKCIRTWQSVPFAFSHRAAPHRCVFRLNLFFPLPFANTNPSLSLFLFFFNARWETEITTNLPARLLHRYGGCVLPAQLSNRK